MIAGLLDTHPVLWELAGDDRVPAWLREGIDRDPSRYGVSDVCLWEIANQALRGEAPSPG